MGLVPENISFKSVTRNVCASGAKPVQKEVASAPALQLKGLKAMHSLIERQAYHVFADFLLQKGSDPTEAVISAYLQAGAGESAKKKPVQYLKKNPWITPSLSVY